MKWVAEGLNSSATGLRLGRAFVHPYVQVKVELSFPQANPLPCYELGRAGRGFPQAGSKIPLDTGRGRR